MRLGIELPPIPARRPFLREIAAILSIPALFGLLESLQLLARTAGSAGALSPGQAFVQTIPRWLLYAPLALGLRAVVRKYPLGHRAEFPSLAVHVAAAALFAVLHLAACVIVYGFLLDGAPNHVSFRLTRLVTVYFAADLLAYAAIAYLWSASIHAEESRSRGVAAIRYRASFERARLDALRSQLQPHFLFNALNAAHVLARRGDSSTVASMLGSLAELLRGTFDEALPHEIPFSRELALLDRYLEIQRIRFGDRVRVVRNISPETLETRVPALVLQPIVENAFEHGVSAHARPSTICISASNVHGELRIEVRDDGPGFRAGGVTPARKGVGLANIRERLRILYGLRATLETGDLAEGGASVVLVIPR